MARLLSGNNSRYRLTVCSGAAVELVVSKAVDNSFKKTMIMEDEFVRNAKNVSAVRLRARWDDIEVIKSVNILRHERGKLDSDGRIGSYQ